MQRLREALVGRRIDLERSEVRTDGEVLVSVEFPVVETREQLTRVRRLMALKAAENASRECRTESRD